jgi:UDP-3-O-[3-hydroxymyristoyl] glucosamine N-acyltransferase
MNQRLTVKEAAQFVDGRLEGDGERMITSIAPIATAVPGQLTFAANSDHFASLGQTRASAALVPTDAPSAELPLIRVASVNAALARLLAMWQGGDDLPPVGTHPTAVVAPDATLGRDVAIGPHVTIGPGATIGDGAALCAGVSVGRGCQIGASSVLFEGVVIRAASRIGKRCRIGPNSVIGFEGYGYYFENGRHNRIPHAGTVELGDDVDLGACTCVDRAKFDATRIGEGTKIDNLVQVGHNVVVGKGCLLVAQCGIAGSAHLGDQVAIGGSAGVRDHVHIGTAAQVSGFAGVFGDVPDGEAVFGLPAGPLRTRFREYKAVRQLPALLKQIRQLEARLAALESSDRPQRPGPTQSKGQ